MYFAGTFSREQRMARVIGLTGGIGCGKTEVARLMSSWGAVVLNADDLGRKIVETDAGVLASLREAFGDRFFDATGALRRTELGDYVFADESRKSLLNTIVHPPLWQRLRDEMSNAVAQGAPLVVVDAALIYETGLDVELETIVVVVASLDHRLERLRRRDGLTDEQILIRIRSQMPVEEKAGRAEYVITNNGTREELARDVRRIFDLLTKTKLQTGKTR